MPSLIVVAMTRYRRRCSSNLYLCSSSRTACGTGAAAAAAGTASVVAVAEYLGSVGGRRPGAALLVEGRGQHRQLPAAEARPTGGSARWRGHTKQPRLRARREAPQPASQPASQSASRVLVSPRASPQIIVAICPLPPPVGQVASTTGTALMRRRRQGVLVLHTEAPRRLCRPT